MSTWPLGSSESSWPSAPAGSETQPVHRKTIISWPWPGSSLALAGAAPAGSETQPVRRSSIISWPGLVLLRLWLEYSTLNSRILMIRTPKYGTPNFRKLPYAQKNLRR